MAKLMALGFSLNQVVEMATTNAAKLLGRTGHLGTLRVGDQAEISILKIDDREWQALDSQKGMIPAKQTITPVYAIRGDLIYEPLPVERP
jgi:dihydroorotase